MLNRFMRFKTQTDKNFGMQIHNRRQPVGNQTVFKPKNALACNQQHLQLQLAEQTSNGPHAGWTCFNYDLVDGTSSV